MSPRRDKARTLEKDVANLAVREVGCSTEEMARHWRGGLLSPINILVLDCIFNLRHFCDVRYFEGSQFKRSPS